MPKNTNVARRMDDARSTPLAMGQLMTVPRTVQTNQLLVMRDPFVTFAAPFVFDRGVNGVGTAVGKVVNAKVTAGPLESVLMSYLFRNSSTPHLNVCSPTMFCMWA